MDGKIALDALATMVKLGRAFGNSRADDGSKPVTNWTTQLLGNRAVSGSAVWELADGEEVEVNISAFHPARELATGKAKKDKVKDFRESYESRLLPEAAARVEILKDMTYLAISIATGRLPTATQVSAESSMKGGILHHLMDMTEAKPISVTVDGGDDGVDLTYDGDAIVGLTRFWLNAHDNILALHDAGPAAGSGIGLDWGDAEVEL